jgi:hypothetical protein
MCLNHILFVFPFVLVSHLTWNQKTPPRYLEGNMYMGAKHCHVYMNVYVCICLNHKFRFIVIGGSHSNSNHHCASLLQLTWLVLGEDPAARSHMVEQFTASLLQPIDTRAHGAAHGARSQNDARLIRQVLDRYINFPSDLQVTQ